MRDPELVHARDERLGLGEAVVGSRRTFTLMPVAASAPSHTASRSGVNALQSVSTIVPSAYRSSRNRFSLGDVPTSVHASSAPGATTSARMPHAEAVLEPGLDRGRESPERRRVAVAR